jgi:hypothetical protein
VPGDTSFLGRDAVGKLIAVGASGIYRQKTDVAARQRTDLTILGMRLPAAFNVGASGFEQVLATRLTFPYSAAINPANGDVAIYNREVLSLYEPQETGRYAERLRKELAGTEAAIVGLAGESLLLGTAAGEILSYNAANLALIKSFEPVAGVPPRFIEVSPDGRRFAVLMHDRTLWIYDVELGTLQRAAVAGQEDISTVAFNGNDRLLVADRVSRVSEYELPSMALVRRVEAEPDWLESLYRYIVNPLYTIFPKPSQISNVTTYLIADQKTMRPPESRDADLRRRQFQLDIWSPIWSNLAFLVVVLALGCVYTARKDF